MSGIELGSLLSKMAGLNATDLYITYGFAPAWRVLDSIVPFEHGPLNDNDIQTLLHQITTPEEREFFEKTKELNIAYNYEKWRFRVNVFYQQTHIGMVIRRVETNIPSLESLNLPHSYQEMVLEKRGLILVTGSTGAGKSTSIAGMLNHRNQHGSGHIITIEDPIEFVHTHNRCLFTQREVGIDTLSWHEALKNALRQRPDVIMIGEIRNKETMEHAMNYAQAGNLAIATLHSMNSSQAIERVMNFFPEEARMHVLYNLSLTLKAIFSQRLVTDKNGGKSLAVEVLLNHGAMKSLIAQGKVHEIRELMEKNKDVGMQTFDQALLQLYRQGIITEEVALAESDSSANLRLEIMQGNMRKQSNEAPTISPSQFVKKPSDW